MLHDTLLQLRILVGYLGEKDQFGLWESSFFSENSDTFLSPVFIKTHFMAKVNGASRAASLLHDQRIGIGDVYHLFRLPEDLELGIFNLLRDTDNKYIELVHDRDNALRQLKAIGNNKTKSEVGPVLIGTVSDLRQNKKLEELAAHYYNSVNSYSHVFPYFSK